MRINIEIGDIEAFIELTETNSFAKAATNLNLSQPALSGRKFYERARSIIEAIKTATKTLLYNGWLKAVKGTLAIK